MEEDYSWYNSDIEITPSESYNPNRDFGHNLAEKVLKNQFLNSYFKEIFDKEKACGIIKKYGVNKIFNSSKQRILLKSILGELERETNISLGYFPKMDTSRMLKLYNDAKRRVGLL
jgi:hypothetical protein